MVKKLPTTTTASRFTAAGVIIVELVRQSLVQIFSCFSRLYDYHNNHHHHHRHHHQQQHTDGQKSKCNNNNNNMTDNDHHHQEKEDNNNDDDEDDDVVQVYILLGQSNMLGMGHVGSKDDITKDGTLQCAVHQKGLYPYLLTNPNDPKTCQTWATSPTVRNVRVMEDKGHMKVFKNEFLTIHDNDRIGPEVGIGHFLEKQAQKTNKIMLLKSCIGNRSLGWDLLPPGSQRYNYKGQTFAGYKDSPDKWDENQPKPDPPFDWYAGKQYDTDIANAKAVLSDLETYYPGATQGYKVMGFFWWQGDKDRYQEAYGWKYEANLVRLIQQLRADFAAPNAKFVLATLGQTEMGGTNNPPNDQAIFEAMLAVDGNSGKYPAFVGNVATVYSHPLSKGGASNGHYNGNAETYMNVGQAMGKAMAELVPNN